MLKTQQIDGQITFESIESLFKDARQSLMRLKNKGVSDIRLSKASIETISSWDTFFDLKPALPSLGAETKDVFIVDEEGSFFQGDAGQLLGKILEAMTLKKDQVYICRISDRNQIISQIESVRPKVIISLGQKAAQLLLESRTPLSDLRGKFYKIKSYPVMPTYHPLSLIRQPALKREVWNDMQLVMAQIGLTMVTGS